MLGMSHDNDTVEQFQNFRSASIARQTPATKREGINLKARSLK